MAVEYRPGLPTRNDNVSHRHPLREFVLLMSALAFAAAGVFWTLGLAVDAAVGHMSAGTEAAVEDAFRRAGPPMSPADPVRQAQLQRLADSLLACARRARPAQVDLAGDSNPNAIALPGGRIIVMSGLLEHVGSENGLAFVLAHEIAHLQHRDHLRAMGRGIVLVTIAAMLGSTGPDVVGMLGPVNQAQLLHHSRERERAADLAALDILACRYGHAGGATEFFRALQRNERKAPARTAHYFDSHPAIDSRIADIERAIRERGYGAGPLTPIALPAAPASRH